MRPGIMRNGQKKVKMRNLKLKKKNQTNIKSSSKVIQETKKNKKVDF